MADEYNIYNELEAQRNLDNQEQEEETEESQLGAQARMGTMFFAILLLLCIVADFIDIITIGTIGWLVGLFVDAILLLSAGLSKAGRKQFKRILIGVIGETLPIPFLAILPFRSLFLTWSFVKSRYELPIQLGLSGHKQTELGE